MKITIEFTGISKAIANTGEVELVMPEQSSYRDLLKKLADTYPGLVGILIDHDRENFLSSNMFVINGDLASPAMIMEDSPADGERISLMSVITGG